MAETVTPSVRGRQRLAVEIALLCGAVGTAALVGFAFGVIAAIVSPVTDPLATVAIVGAGIALDATCLLVGWPKPLTLGRQVPREWGRLLSPSVTAFLYGGRLGVGPLTILSTWMWWAMLIAAALGGVWVSVAVSVWFAAGRVVINGIVGRRLSRHRSANLAAVQSFRRAGWSGLTGIAAVLTIATAFLAGCGSPHQDATRTTIRSESVPVAAATPPPTSPAQLEDFVRTSPTLVADTSSTTVAEAQPANPPVDDGDADVGGDVTPLALADLAPSSLVGMTVIDDPGVDRFLTIDEAAAIQPDPTEEIALLETRGYQGGWIRAFRSPTSDIAVTAVYEFADATEAEFYLEDGLITIGGYGGQFFDIAELPGIRGFQQDVVDDGETVRTLGGAFHRDNRWFLLYVVGSAQTVTPEMLVGALQSWLADLGR